MDLKLYLEAGETSISNLLLRYYRQLKMTEEELIFYLQLQRKQQQGDAFPDLNQLAKEMNIQAEALYQLLDRLMQKQVITIETRRTENGKQEDVYDLTLVYDQIQLLLSQASTATPDEKQVMREIEQLIGSVLSGSDIMMLHEWLSGYVYDPALIKLAVKEAVVQQVQKPLAYAAKILERWQNENVTTIEEATAQITQHRQQMAAKNDHHSTLKVPIYHDL